MGSYVNRVSELLAFLAALISGSLYAQEVNARSIRFESPFLSEGKFDVSVSQNETFYIPIVIHNLGSKPRILNFAIDGGSSRAIDIKHLVAWYKDSNAKKTIHHGGEAILVEELLVHDPDLIQPNPKKKENLIQFSYKGKTKFLSSGVLQAFPSLKDGRIRMNANDYVIHDAQTLQPRTVLQNQSITIILRGESQQLVEGINVVSLQIHSANESHRLALNIQKLPVQLSAPQLKYSVFYRGCLSERGNTLSSENKSPQQLSQELAHISAAKFINPTVYQSPEPNRAFNTYWQIRKSKIPDYDEIYITDSRLTHAIGDRNYNRIDTLLQGIDRILSGNNVKKYVLVKDEPFKRELKNYHSVIQYLHKKGYQPLITGHYKHLKDHIVEGALLAIAYEPKREIAEKVHSKGGLAYSYANPQAGVIDDELIRFNYGFNLIKNHYDGALIYAYQDSRGSAWSDFDGRYRDHMLSYPTSNGVISTVSWMGLEQAIVDAAYFETLRLKHTELIDRKCPSTLLSMVKETLDAVDHLDINGVEKYRNSIAVALAAITKKEHEC